MEKLSYDLTEVEESMKDTSCILDSTISRTHRTIPERRGRLLHPTPGRFCIAFPMDPVDGRGSRICYRVWKEIIPDAFRRYQFIGEGISKSGLEYFSGFRFIQEALKMKCDGRIMPGIVMDWIEGVTLDRFLNEKWGDLDENSRLAFIQDFYCMCYRLREAGIAHGDLSCLNIMVTSSNSIRLVDYDSVYVPGMGSRFYQVTGGADGFQHPGRLNPGRPLLAGVDDDNFSELVIALSLWTAFFEPSVTRLYDESNLLFLPEDLFGKTGIERLEHLRGSEGWKTAGKYRTRFTHMDVLMKALESIRGPVSQVPSLPGLAGREAIMSEDFYPKLNVALTHKVAYCTACGHRFPDYSLDYCTACGTKRHVYKA